MSNTIIESTPFDIQQVIVEVVSVTEAPAQVVTLVPTPSLSIQPDIGNIDIVTPQESLIKTLVETALTVVQQAPIIKIEQSVAARIWNSNLNKITKDAHIGSAGTNALTLGPITITNGVLITVEAGTLWRII